MSFRFAVVLGSLLLITIPAAGSEQPKTENPLAAAAEQMRLGNYSTAAGLAAPTPARGERSLLLGIAALKAGRHEEAATLLAGAAGSFPLLADYALFYQAAALTGANRPADALIPLQALTTGYPQSPLVRRALLQQADILFTTGNFPAADVMYLKFIERYAAGSDALQASYRRALCRERSGDLSGAAKMLRSLWLTSPASAEAGKTESDLQRLAAAGVAIPPYTSQELFKRGATLYDQRSYSAALKTLRAIEMPAEHNDFSDRLQLKIAQTLLKSRQLQEAQQLAAALASAANRRETRIEAALILARAKEKSGRDEEAFVAYTDLAGRYPDSDEAANALLQAALIRKFQYRPADAAELCDKVLAAYPDTRLKQRLLWESGWGNYLVGRFREAAERFAKLLDNSDYREKALYWHGRALAAAGETGPAADSHATLRKEFPYGFYALQLGDSSTPPSPPPLEAAVARPQRQATAYGRVTALISLGLVDDAAIELAAEKNKQGKNRDNLGLAQLYQEIGNYHGAMALFSPSARAGTSDTQKFWPYLFPQAYRELVQKYAAEAEIDPSLTYAIIRAESSFLKSAKSPVGARGLMQLMPATAAAVLKTKNVTPERLYDPELNIRLGTRHLRDLLDAYKGNRIAAIASYNAGAHNVDRWLKTYANLSGDDFIESIPYGETREYVKKVLATAAFYRQFYAIR